MGDLYLAEKARAYKRKTADILAKQGTRQLTTPSAEKFSTRVMIRLYQPGLVQKGDEVFISATGESMRVSVGNKEVGFVEETAPASFKAALAEFTILIGRVTRLQSGGTHAEVRIRQG